MSEVPVRIKVIVYDEDESYETTAPGYRVVCPRCGGSGTHDHPAFSNGITGSEWAEWEPEERENYMNGTYDVPCEECHGRNVVDEIDWETWEGEDPKSAKLHLDHLRGVAADHAEQEYCRRYGI